MKPITVNQKNVANLFLGKNVLSQFDGRTMFNLDEENLWTKFGQFWTNLDELIK